jgi:glycolate oxidase FAD binding subunit
MAERALASRSEAAHFVVHGTPPAFVHTPADAAEAALIVRECAAARAPVECAGAGTWLSWGRAPARVEHVVSVARISDIVEYNPADLTISVDAGATLDTVHAAVAAHNQVLPLDAPALPGATVGATAALACAGPLRLGWGTPRDQVLGVEVVAGDGRRLRFGGRVVKNVAGYDITRLFVGSRGTLGLITRLHLRLRPAPLADVTVAAFGARPAPLIALARAAALPLLPAALELLVPSTARALGLPEPAWCVLARFRGNRPAVQAAVGQWTGAARAHRPALLRDSDAASAWSALARSEAAAAVSVRFAALPANLLETVHFGAAAVAGGLDARPERDLRAFPHDWLAAAHVGAGIVRVWRASAATDDRLADDLLAVRVALESLGGGVLVERAPADVLRRAVSIGDAGPAARLARGLKEVFDPAGILAAGRLVR